MAFEEALHGMYDTRLKPRLLSSIMATHLPDDRQPPKSPSELSTAVSIIRRHHLLSEPILVDPPVACPPGKATDAYKAVVDAWIERVNILLLSTTTEKCWAGVCLLGVTCQECTRQRFLDSYTSWFQKLIMHLKPTDPLFVRGAAFASLTDLLIRLGSTGVRREGTGLSVKLVQPVLQLLSEEGSKSIWNDGVDLLCTMLKFFPASLKQQSSQVEALLVAKLMEVDISASLSEKFAQCLASLPKAHGDAATWNSLFRRMLLAINSYLDDAFAGMEDGTMAKKVLAALMPRGQEQTLFLGGMSVAANAMTEGAKKFWQLLVPRISVLMQCCDYLLVNSFPVQVPVPLAALLALITRILSVDGSLYRSPSVLGAPVSSSQQVSLCCELPALHSCALDLLYATLCGVRSQLLPRATDIVRLLTEYFRRCGSPSLRIKLYSISKHLLISMGVGMASELAPPLIDNLLADLKGAANVCAPCSINSPNVPAWAQGVLGWGHSPSSRKRKDPGSMQMDMLPALRAMETGADISDATCTVAVQIAALEAMEALLTVGGSLRSDHWRTEVDSVVANVALVASAGALSPSLVFEDTSCKGESLAFASGSFQLAAYKAFLASILSPCTHRPPFLSQALSVFRKGRQEAAGTEIAEFCAHALLALEPLIHPRSLPFASTPATTPSITPGRGPAFENLVSQMRRPGLPSQGAAGSMPTAATVSSQGYSSQLAPPSLKVTDAGMQIEVEGDPYVQEDIESWIVDYGGEQGVLNDSSSMMVVEGFDGEFQAMGSVPRSVVAGLGNVSARQSLADDEDRMMMSMVGDMLTESREAPKALPSEMPTRGNYQINDVSGDVSGLYRGQPGKIELALKEMDPSAVPASSRLNVCPLPVEQVLNADSAEIQLSLVTAKDALSVTALQHEIGKPQQDLVPSAADVGFSAVVTGNLSESDSDAIPDIVDGDPDTD